MRGEYWWQPTDDGGEVELPPRARRILVDSVMMRGKNGTTSACAENTYPKQFWDRKHWNYLRVRGEYLHIITNDGADLELPPRARRILADDLVDGIALGTTSACAENTLNELGLL